MVADEEEVSKLVEISRGKRATNLIVGAGAVHVDVEVRERLIGAHGDEVGDIEVRGLKEVDFAADVEVHETFERAVCGDDAGWDRGVLAIVAEFGPVFVAAASGFADRNGQG